MNTCLFFDDDAKLFSTATLREAARDVVRASPLICRASEGEKLAAEALHIGFWPFVREFEIAIDKQRLPRDPLKRRFNDTGRLRINKVFTELAKAVREMKEEEGSHAQHWQKDAQCLGLPVLNSPFIASVQALIDSSYSKDLPQFFSVLAGTEFIAEELSIFLTAQPAYLALFSRNRWVWGDVHLIPHVDGPSHLEIDLDLARAYSSDDGSAKTSIPAMVMEAIRLFEQAAFETEAILCKTSMISGAVTNVPLPSDA